MDTNPAKEGAPAIAHPCDMRKPNSATRSTQLSLREAMLLANILEMIRITSIIAARPRGN